MSDEVKKRPTLKEVDDAYKDHDRATCKADCCLFCFMDVRREHDLAPCAKSICIFCDMRE